ncbi:MAG: lamin tail domain-containing protein [Patescibacteria group bacterium]
MFKRLGIFLILTGIIFFQIIETEKMSAESFTYDFYNGHGLDLAEIQEELDDISEEVDILKRKIMDLTENGQVLGASMERGEETTEESIKEKKEESKLCEITPGIWPKPDKVAINEVAWMGNESGASGEWIEIKNVSEKEMDLTGWQLLNSDSQIAVVFGLGDLISSGDFYILERGSDEVLQSIDANKIYSGALKNGEEGLYLFDDNCELQDLVLADPEWPTGDNSTKRTMERTNDFFWQTSFVRGGTPGAENGEAYYRSSGNQNLPVACSQANLSLVENPSVIINEVAWMGSVSSTYDEWIELKNVSTAGVSLNRWQLIGVNTGSGKNNIEVFFGKKDKINSFYLLERSDDEAVVGIPADKIFSGSINDSDFALRLFDDKCRLIDEVAATPDWPAGRKTGEKRTAERGEDSNWHDSFATSSFSGLFGTPREENSQMPKLPPVLEMSTDSLSFKGEKDEIVPNQIITFTNSGGSDLNWSIDLNLIVWFLINGGILATGTIPASDSIDIEFSIIPGLAEGDYSATATVEIAGQNDSKSISAGLTIYQKTVKTVIINEIAWMGTEASSSQEWIEIYNNADADIDLRNWEIRKDGNAFILFNASSSTIGDTIIPARYYYILERKFSNFFETFPADFIYGNYSNTYAMRDTGNKIQLLDDSDSLIDEIDCLDGWFAGSNTILKQTMERIDPEMPGSDPFNWASSSSPGGTPKAQNSIVP